MHFKKNKCIFYDAHIYIKESGQINRFDILKQLCINCFNYLINRTSFFFYENH